MQEEQVKQNLKGMDDLDFIGWNNADWQGVFAHHHTDDVLVDWKGQEPTHGIENHIDAMKAFVESAGGTPPQITSHPIAFGSGEWTCVIGEFEGGGPHGHRCQVARRRHCRRIHLVIVSQMPAGMGGMGSGN
jgi:hypothetical protein